MNPLKSPLSKGDDLFIERGASARHEARLKIPSDGGVTRSAGVGSPIDNPHQIVSYA